MDYTSLQKETRSHGEYNDCAVKALALATGASYKQARQALADQGRQPRKGTPFFMTEKATEALGFELERYYPAGRTVRTVARELGEGRFYVRVRRHILCVVDGVVQDWSDNRLIRVNEVYRVVPKGYRPAAKPPVVIRTVVPVNKPGSVAEQIWAAMDRVWEAAGKPTDKKVVLRLRKSLMDSLEAQGFKRNTASNELGKWQKFNIK